MKPFIKLKNKLNSLYDYSRINYYSDKDSQNIYHIHIRKTGGTSINFAFLSSLTNNPDDSYNKLISNRNNFYIEDGKIIVGWNKNLINKGKFNYAFSHLPIHQLTIPKNIYKITCFRNPLDRVISHYNMLKYYLINSIPHPVLKTEGKWLENGFQEFIIHMPKEHLLNQLYMFSKNFSINEAFENIMSCNKILFTESLEADLKDLESELDLNLSLFNKKKYGYRDPIEASDLEFLKNKLGDEYTLLKFRSSLKC